MILFSEKEESTSILLKFHLFIICKYNLILYKYGRIFPPKFYVSNLVFVYLSLQFNFVKYVIVAFELPKDNSLDQRMLLKN